MLVKTAEPATSPARAASTSSESASQPPTYDEAVREPAERLQAQITTYNALEDLERGNSHEAEAQKVADTMQEIGDRHTDVKEKKAWHKRAKEFRSASNKLRRKMLENTPTPLHVLLVVPMAAICISTRVVGVALQASGAAIGAVGNALAGQPNSAPSRIVQARSPSNQNSPSS
jgi:hypothetical protein